MRHRSSLLVVVVLTLLLAACSPYHNSQVVNAQATKPSAIAPISEPPPTAERLVILSTPISASSVTTRRAEPTATVEATEAPSTAISTGPALNDASHNCPVTRPPELPFTPPSPYSHNAPGNNFWYGTDSLWTAVPGNGVWSGLPHNPAGYTQKVLWWRIGYSWTDEPEPHLSVTGRRLDAPAPPLNVSKATNAFAEDIGAAMLVGVDFPTPGCWEITGRYAGNELSFVVQVAP
jgi:hypothetical protein